MFSNIYELTSYYCDLYGFSYEFLETLPKYMFLRHNREIFKRYIKSYKELLKFERAENKAKKRYWYYKEHGDIVNMNKWLNKIKFLRDKRKRVTYRFTQTEEKQSAKNAEENSAN